MPPVPVTWAIKDKFSCDAIANIAATPFTVGTIPKLQPIMIIADKESHGRHPLQEAELRKPSRPPTP